ncbi:hypothetical protein BC938DRAFT_482869 [Jimgerdemannia flammicorona]|uniref:RING-type domain-containing protein n=2 Tax=Jimgerdemannia flammicorona TaxID=994334 RepID=A0A433QD52_9FUNG|nr:hypothetical protein BC938DRAFT_482869 [Jimgerdemannia flammicorona]
MANGPGTQYHNHLSHTIPPLRPFNTEKYCAQCGAKFGLFKHQYNCKNCGSVICSSCSDHRHAIPKFGYFTPVRCCNTCNDFLMMQKMDATALMNQPVKTLRRYIAVYNLPSQSAIEKKDLVKLIEMSRPISDAAEIWYRANLHVVVPRISAEEARVHQAQQQQQQNGTRRRGASFGSASDRTAPRTRTDNGSANWPQSGNRSAPQPQQRQTPTNYPGYQNASSYPGPPPHITPQQSQQWSYPPQPEQPQPQTYSYTYNYSYNSHPPPPPQPYPHAQAPRPPQPHALHTPQSQPNAQPPRPPQPQPQNLSHLSPHPNPRVSSSSPQPSSLSHSNGSSSYSSSLNPPPSLASLISARVDPATLSVKTLKAVLKDNFVEHGNVLEKSELVARVQRLFEDKQKDMNVNTDYLPDEQLCRICCDAPQNCVFLECGHLTCCMDCGKKLVEKKNECPICREPILKMLHVFRS